MARNEDMRKWENLLWHIIAAIQQSIWLEWRCSPRTQCRVSFLATTFFFYVSPKRLHLPIQKENWRYFFKFFNSYYTRQLICCYLGIIGHQLDAFKWDMQKWATHTEIFHQLTKFSPQIYLKRLFSTTKMNSFMLHIMKRSVLFQSMEKSNIYWFYKSFLLILWVNMLIMCTGMAFGSGYLSLTSGRPNKVLFIGFRVRLNCDILATLTHSHFVTIKCGPKTYQQQLTRSFTGSHLRKPVSW